MPSESLPPGDGAPETARITKAQAKDLRDVCKLAFGEQFAALLRQDLGVGVDESLTLTRLTVLVTPERYQALLDGYEACLRQEQEADVPG